MFSVILYFIFIYWVLLALTLKSNKHYFFQFFLFLFIVQSLVVISAIEAHSFVLLGSLHLKYFWYINLIIYLVVYIYWLSISLVKTFPNIFTMEWWEAFHIYNWCSFLRAASNSKQIITNSEWLKNQQSSRNIINIQYVLIIKNLIKLFCYFFFVYLLVFCRSIDSEFLLFKLDFFIYTYYLFLPLLTFVYLLVASVFFKKLHLKYWLMFFSFSIESRFVDKASFDSNFGFMLSLEDLAEYQLYSSNMMYCKNPASHKKSMNNRYDLSLSDTTDSSRLVWNDMWWDCNTYYFSRLYKTKLTKKYKNNN